MTETQWFVTAAISMGAMLVALVSAMVNYRLARQVADRPGRLHRIWFEPREPEDGRGFDVVLSNGPSALTIDDLYLTVRFQLPRRHFLRADRVFFCVRQSDFHLLGITGPALPRRIDGHDIAKWHLPSTMGMPYGCNVEFRWHGRTALGERFTSPVLRIGYFEGVHWLSNEDVSHESIGTYLDHLTDRYPLVADLISRQRSGRLADAQRASTPEAQPRGVGNRPRPELWKRPG